MLAIFLVGILMRSFAATNNAAVGQFEEWFPFTPSASQTTLDHWAENGISYIRVSIEVESSGYEVRDWGTPTIVGNGISVRAEMWRWFGVVIPVMLRINHTYNLGQLPDGEYVFTFNVWWSSVRSLTFNVFTIVPGKIVIPDDYPTIQEAINAANEGDTIFVRNGTYYEHVLINKSLTLTGESMDGTILNATDVEPLVIIQADNVQIMQFTMQGWSFQDVIINASANVIVTRNKFAFNGLGVDFENSHNCTTNDNIFEGSGLDNIGIMVAQSYECVIKNNTISGAISDGVRSWFSRDVLITENNISHNDYGIFLHTSENNTISGNHISNNSNVGIVLEATSVNNTIFANTLDSNFLGVYSSSSYNVFFHNNFVNNTSQVSASPANVWDRNAEGNYWSDYDGTDSDGDGIGDTPYVIDSSNQDNYPLMNPYWSPSDVNYDLKVDVRDVYAVAKAYGASLDGPSPPGVDWNPHCDIDYDGKVDMKDYYVVCRNYGETYS